MQNAWRELAKMCHVLLANRYALSAVASHFATRVSRKESAIGMFVATRASMIAPRSSASASSCPRRAATSAAARVNARSSSLLGSPFTPTKVSVAPRRAAASRGSAVRVNALFGPPPNPELLLAEGKAKYAEGERMQGYKTFEKALRAEDIPLEVRQELLYCCMCCCAAFGDVETAKQHMRDMNLAGMPFDVAMLKEEYMPMEAGAQMKNQLKKFAAGELKSQGTVQREIFERQREASGMTPAGGGGQKPQRMGDMDLMNLDLNDTSAEVGDIAKRVGGLVVLSIVGFIGLFQAGLTLLR